MVKEETRLIYGKQIRMGRYEKTINLRNLNPMANCGILPECEMEFCPLSGA